MILMITEQYHRDEMCANREKRVSISLDHRSGEMRTRLELLEGRGDARTVVVILRECGDDGDLSGGGMDVRRRR